MSRIEEAQLIKRIAEEPTSKARSECIYLKKPRVKTDPEKITIEMKVREARRPLYLKRYE
ncbi:MAG: hypothetical protein JSV35_06335 [Candidatus Bathyarchaeota archaeon]|nr:MAG: hypothetical protein JSV35_06335 [Candidatus Bathyarchaeota archaeon]